VGLGGLEPPASPLSGVRSNHLSYRPGKSSLSVCGASRVRTDDPLLAKQVLSQLSYGPVEDGGRQNRTCIFRWRGLASELWLQVPCVGVWQRGCLVSKGGDPAAPSDTATLLRLHPSH
jgi:hypothetical protein